MSVSRPSELRKRRAATNHAVLMLDRAEYEARLKRRAAHEAHKRLIARKRLTQSQSKAMSKRLSQERQDAYETSVATAAAAYLREVAEPAPALEF